MLSDKQLEAKLDKNKLQEMSDCLADYIESGVSANLSRNEQLALTVKALKLLSNLMKEMSIPVTLGTLVNNFGMLTEAVDRAFPGYADAGLLKYMISSRN